MDKNNVVVSVLVVALIVIGLIIFSRQDIPNFLSTGENTSPTNVPSPNISPTPTPSDSVVVELSPVNSSLYNQTGTAVLTQNNNRVIVKISINQPSGVANIQPVHIHAGTCPGAGRIIYSLNNIVEGKSETTINTTLDKLESREPLVINIHKSSSEIGVYTACGSLFE